MHRSITILIALTALSVVAKTQGSYSGIYPHLAFFNDENECGTGAIVPWADRLWVVTYAPHAPRGSSDKLYEITPDLQLIVRPESIGGTPANRMIHRESQQLFIGPYVIAADGAVRVIPSERMFGRLTGNARHLDDPQGKVYFATMEEGLYEVDVETLEVHELYADNAAGRGPQSGLPGYHGKGLYSGQGRVLYANNGERGSQVMKNPFVPSGVLAEWDGADWNVVLRNQFTEITGPGGIYGNEQPADDPIWSIGWDAKSLILMMLDEGEWHRFRLPKSSHSYDGAHGWNTEWPRIRDIGEDDLLMTMHGMFWRFPRGFRGGNTSGVAPRSSYLKVVGDFCSWQGRVVLGCDDTAKSEFLNRRKAKGSIAAPQSQSNLWFLEHEQLDQLGPALGRGAVWLNEELDAGAVSDPFLIDGFSRRAVHLVTSGETTVSIEVDVHGDGEWSKLDEIEAGGYVWYPFDESLDATWVRLRTSAALERATAWFHFAGEDHRDGASKPGMFAGLLGTGGDSGVGGLIRARAGNERTLQFGARDSGGKLGLYILDAQMKLARLVDDEQWDWMHEQAAIPQTAGALDFDAASVIYIDDGGRRFRLPRNEAYVEPGPLGRERLCREVATERDLFNCHGTFYELPAENAGGFARVRPVSTHGLRISDYCSYRGLLVFSGVDLSEAGDNSHVLRSEDGKAALWVGAIDDVWELGKPVGEGGPWLDTGVEAGQPSDPYLMCGYDRMSLHLESARESMISVEVDLTGMGDWEVYKVFPVDVDSPLDYEFPAEFQAYWVRFRSSVVTRATAQLSYR